VDVLSDGALILKSDIRRRDRERGRERKRERMYSIKMKTLQQKTL
jgi:hypothetical protein